MTKNEENIIIDFRKRRASFDSYLKKTGRNDSCFSCPSCGYPTLSDRSIYDICPICVWEDDGQDDFNADKVLGGPNSNLSLTDSRLNIGKKLNELAERSGGKLIENPEKILPILDKYNSEMKTLEDKIQMDNNENNWDEYFKNVKFNLADLVELSNASS